MEEQTKKTVRVYTGKDCSLCDDVLDVIDDVEVSFKIILLICILLLTNCVFFYSHIPPNSLSSTIIFFLIFLGIKLQL